MKKAVFLIILSMAFFANISYADFEKATQSETHSPSATICSDPANSCKDERFGPNDLSFNLAKELKWQNTYYSVEFYAILLMSVKSKPDDGLGSDKACAGYFGEKKRKEIQTFFLKRKVFSSRFGCSHHPVSYTGTNSKYNFLAVFAGNTMKESQKALAEAKATGKFKGANIRKMRVVYDFGD
jgi:hypothetical protein